MSLESKNTSPSTVNKRNGMAEARNEKASKGRPAPPTPPSHFPIKIVQDHNGERRVCASRNISAGEVVLSEHAIIWESYMSSLFEGMKDVGDSEYESLLPEWTLKMRKEDPYHLRAPSNEMLVRGWPITYSAWKMGYNLRQLQETWSFAVPNGAARIILQNPSTKDCIDFLVSETNLPPSEILSLNVLLEANSFALEDPCATNCSYGTAVFPFSSYFNHSCYPNLVKHIDAGYESDRPSIRLVARCDVKEGEELCYAYGPNCDVQPREQRKLGLCFSCWCPVCSSPPGTYVCEVPPYKKKDCVKAWAGILNSADTLKMGAMSPTFLSVIRSRGGWECLTKETRLAGNMMLGQLTNYMVSPVTERIGIEEYPTREELVKICDFLESEFFGLSAKARASFPLFLTKRLEVFLRRKHVDDCVLELQKTVEHFRISKPGLYEYLCNYITIQACFYLMTFGTGTRPTAADIADVFGKKMLDSLKYWACLMACVPSYMSNRSHVYQKLSGAILRIETVHAFTKSASEYCNEEVSSATN